MRDDESQERDERARESERETHAKDKHSRILTKLGRRLAQSVGVAPQLTRPKLVQTPSWGQLPPIPANFGPGDHRADFDRCGAEIGQILPNFGRGRLMPNLGLHRTDLWRHRPTSGKFRMEMTVLDESGRTHLGLPRRRNETYLGTFPMTCSADRVFMHGSQSAPTGCACRACADFVRTGCGWSASGESEVYLPSP